MSKVAPLKRFVWSLTDLDFGDQGPDGQFCEHGALTAACNSAACRPPTSGGTGGSSPGFNPPNGANMNVRLRKRFAIRKAAEASDGEISIGPPIEGMAKAWAATLPDDPRVRIRVPESVLESIASDGVLTQRDTGKSGGRFDPSLRDQVEEWMFGKPGTDPRYGYILTRRGEQSGSAWAYGDVALELKPSVHSRVTVTSSDSLAPEEDMAMAPVPFNEIRTASDKRLWAASDSPVRPNEYTHFEAQIHGTIVASDIARVITSYPDVAERARVLFPDAEIVLMDTDEFETVTIGFVTGAFEMACESHNEFACKSAACRPPTSGGTGGSLPGPRGGTPGPYGQPKSVDAVKQLFESEVGTISEYSDRVTAKTRSTARVSQRMLEDPEFTEWSKEVLDMKHQTPNDRNGMRVAIANRIIREAGMNKDDTKTLRDAIQSLTDQSPEEFLAERVAAEFIKEWSYTSSDHSPPAVAMQFAAAKLHGVSDSALRSRSDMYPEVITTADKYLEHDGKILSSFARAEYAATQAFFKEKGITSVTAFRGMVINENEPAAQAKKKSEVDLVAQPLSSWSSSSGEAHGFARDTEYQGEDKGRSLVLSMEIPVSAIQSIPLTGRGCLAELEIVAIGFTSTATVVESFR